MTDVRQTIKEMGQPALAVLDRIDVEQQSAADPEVNEAVEQLVRLRDALIERHRAGEDCGEWLGRTNAVLSGIFGVEYPVGGIQWQRIVETRDDLRHMLGGLD